MKKNIKIQYFALLKEQRGTCEEIYETVSQTPCELYAELQKNYGLTCPSKQMRVSINFVFAGWDSPLKTGDTIVFIPPVSGG